VRPTASATSWWCWEAADNCADDVLEGEVVKPVEVVVEATNVGREIVGGRVCVGRMDESAELFNTSMVMFPMSK
jgi:hypothetical protein